MKTLSMMNEKELRRKQVFDDQHSLYMAMEQCDHQSALVAAQGVIITLKAIIGQEDIEQQRQELRGKANA